MNLCLYLCPYYPACKAHLFYLAFYCNVWSVCLYHVFPPRNPINVTISRKSVLSIKCVLILSRIVFIQRRIQRYSFIIVHWYSSKAGHEVAQLVGVLRYKPEDRGFDSRWCHWIFSLTQSFRPHCGLGVDSASNRNEYQECFLGVKAAGASDFHETWIFSIDFQKNYKILNFTEIHIVCEPSCSMRTDGSTDRQTWRS
jgi:hypothetical protein